MELKKREVGVVLSAMLNALPNVVEKREAGIVHWAAMASCANPNVVEE